MGSRLNKPITGPSSFLLGFILFQPKSAGVAGVLFSFLYLHFTTSITIEQACCSGDSVSLLLYPSCLIKVIFIGVVLYYIHPFILARVRLAFSSPLALFLTTLLSIYSWVFKALSALLLYAGFKGFIYLYSLIVASWANGICCREVRCQGD